MPAGTRKYFLSFCDSRMFSSMQRIYFQAKNMNIYDIITVHNENNLDADFVKKFKNKIVFGSKGFGYWVWKPQIILQTFRYMEYGDILNYCDIGCWLNPKGKERLAEYFELTEKSKNGLLVFSNKNTFNDPDLDTDNVSAPEYKYTKGDLFDYFSVRKFP